MKGVGCDWTIIEWASQSNLQWENGIEMRWGSSYPCHSMVLVNTINPLLTYFYLQQSDKRYKKGSISRQLLCQYIHSEMDGWDGIQFTPHFFSSCFLVEYKEKVFQVIQPTTGCNEVKDKLVSDTHPTILLHSNTCLVYLAWKWTWVSFPFSCFLYLPASFRPILRPLEEEREGNKNQDPNEIMDSLNSFIHPSIHPSVVFKCFSFKRQFTNCPTTTYPINSTSQSQQ